MNGVVLVANVSMQIRDLVRQALEEAYGVVVEEVDCSRDVISRVLSEPGKYSLVVCDNSLPEVGGLEIAAYFVSQGVDVPFVLASEHGYNADELNRLPVSAVTRKPFELFHLIEVVEKYLK